MSSTTVGLKPLFSPDNQPLYFLVSLVITVLVYANKDVILILSFYSASPKGRVTTSFAFYISEQNLLRKILETLCKLQVPAVNSYPVSFNIQLSLIIENFDLDNSSYHSQPHPTIDLSRSMKFDWLNIFLLANQVFHKHSESTYDNNYEKGLFLLNFNQNSYQLGQYDPHGQQSHAFQCNT